MKPTLRFLSLVLSLGFLASIFSGCATGPDQRRAGEYIDDQTINARVKTALLRNEAVAGFDVSTTTFDGVVQLSGFVDTEEERQAAEEVAMGVDGVQMVINNVSVNPRAQQQYGAPRDQELPPMEDPAVQEPLPPATQPAPQTNW
jgi:hyperosmotically inducible periplasmic protein